MNIASYSPVSLFSFYHITSEYGSSVSTAITLGDHWIAVRFPATLTPSQPSGGMDIRVRSAAAGREAVYSADQLTFKQSWRFKKDRSYITTSRPRLITAGCSANSLASTSYPPPPPPFVLLSRNSEELKMVEATLEAKRLGEEVI
jgi:hypothetical protein